MEKCIRKLFIVVLILTLGIRQSTSTSLCITCSAPSACTGCHINADVVTVSNTSWSYDNPATGTPYLEANLQFTAYSVTTTTSMAGKCITHTSSPVPLVDEYLVPIPNVEYLPAVLLQTISGLLVYTPNYIEANAKYSAFLDDAYSSFYDGLGYKGCTAILPPSPIFPTYIGDLAATSATASPPATPVGISPTTVLSTNPPEVSRSVERAKSTRTIIISVIVPTTALVIPLLCFILLRKYRKRRSQVSSTTSPGTTSDVQLYVDQKAELEDEERRRHELDASGIAYEMEGEDRIFEMPGDGDTEIRTAQSDRTQELRGAEHSKELEVPSNL